MNRWLSFLLALLLLGSLTACKPEEQPIPPDPVPTPAPEAEDEVEVLTPATPLPPIDPVPRPSDAPADYVIDDTLLQEHSQTIEQIWPASNDCLLVFTSTLSGGYGSEQISLYIYDLQACAFTGDHISLGLVGQYPHTIFDDGTVMVLTRNTETYEYENMVFIDPYALTFEKHSLSAVEDLRSVHVSPDKRYAALSTQQGVHITDLTMENILAVYPGYVPEGGDPDLDYILPTVTGWMPDGSGVTGKLLGWEWAYHPFLLSTEGIVTPLETYDGKTVLPWGNDLLICDSETHAPEGRCAIDGSAYQPLDIDTAALLEYTAYLSALRTDTAGRLLVMATVTPGSDAAGRAELYRDGTLLHTITLPSAGPIPTSFDAAAFTPDGTTLLLMTGATVDQPCTIRVISIE